MQHRKSREHCAVPYLTEFFLASETFTASQSASKPFSCGTQEQGCQAGQGLAFPMALVM